MHGGNFAELPELLKGIKYSKWVGLMPGTGLVGMPLLEI